MSLTWHPQGWLLVQQQCWQQHHHKSNRRDHIQQPFTVAHQRPSFPAAVECPAAQRPHCCAAASNLPRHCLHAASPLLLAAVCLLPLHYYRCASAADVTASNAAAAAAAGGVLACLPAAPDCHCLKVCPLQLLVLYCCCYPALLPLLLWLPLAFCLPSTPELMAVAPAALLLPCQWASPCSCPAGHCCCRLAACPSLL